ncbi:MAG TPA: hypothetical protein VFT66_05710, partial [Roseiflexaceae bacterium]|nr:hypothetical protein [Roseiflexaceae bacterium]
LAAANDACARNVLAAAHRLLMERAAMIDDEALRQLFLEQVPYHRAIMTAWEAHSAVTATCTVP